MLISFRCSYFGKPLALDTISQVFIGFWTLGCRTPLKYHVFLAFRRPSNPCGLESWSIGLQKSLNRLGYLRVGVSGFSIHLHNTILCVLRVCKLKLQTTLTNLGVICFRSRRFSDIVYAYLFDFVLGGSALEHIGNPSFSHRVWNLGLHATANTIGCHSFGSPRVQSEWWHLGL